MGIREYIASLLVKVSFRFERFFPQIIKFFVNRKLEEYKKRGLISDYRVKARRKGRYHYSFIIDLSLDINRGGEEHG